MEKSNAAAIPPCRPWYRLHLSTWLTLPIGLVVAVLVVLPGGVGRYPAQTSPFDQSSDFHNAIVHGWPFPFLWRTPPDWSGDVARATLDLPWTLTDSVRDFRLFWLAIDLTIAGVGVAAFVALAEWWRRQRLRAYQFTLRELLVIASLLAIVFGLWGRRRAVDHEIAARLDGLRSITRAILVPRLPLWLRILVGDRRLAWLGFNGLDFSITLNWDRSRQQDIQYIVEQFPREAMIVMGERVTSDDVAAAAGMERLERIAFWYPLPDADLTRVLTMLEGNTHLREVSIGTRWQSNFDDAKLARLATLPRLESLSISDAKLLTARGLSALRNCRNLTDLDLGEAGLTKDVMDCLGSMKKLRRLYLSQARFIGTDVSALSRLDRLEELDLSGSNAGDGDARQLRAFPSLRILNLGQTEITVAAVEELLGTAPDFSAHNFQQIELDDTICDEADAAAKKLPGLVLIPNWTGG